MIVAAHILLAAAFLLLAMLVASRLRRAASDTSRDAPSERQRRRPVVAVIGANRGIGLEIARLLVERGDRTVVMTARDVSAGREASKRAAGSIKDDDDPPLLFAPFDVRNPSHRRRLASYVEEHFGRLDGLVCSAAISDRRRNDAATTRDVLATNVYGTAETVRSLLPSLRAAGRGSARIVIVASQRGRLDLLFGRARSRVEAATTSEDVEEICREYEDLRCEGDPTGAAAGGGWPWADAYGVSKLFGIALTRALAEELRPDGICVVAACPGWCRTDMGTSMAPRSASEGADTPSYLAALESSELRSGALYHDRKVIPW